MLFFNPPQTPDAVVAEKVNDYKTRNRHYQQVWDIVNLYNDHLCQDSLTRLPTLIIWGKEDKIYDISGAKRLQACTGSNKLIQLPQVGHLPMMENPMEVASRYAGFLKTSEGR